MTFKLIEFGKTSGEEEAAEVPHLIADGYFDNDFIEPFLTRRKWLVLARKGAGKSLLGEKLKQLASSSKENIAANLTHRGEIFLHPFLRGPTISSWSKKEIGRAHV